MSMKDLRLKAGMLQVDVAKIMDVDQACVSKWDNGVTKPPRKRLEKLAKLYGCTVDELKAEAGKAPGKT